MSRFIKDLDESFSDSKKRSLFGFCHTHPCNVSPKSVELLLERGGLSTDYLGGIGWSKRFWPYALLARIIVVSRV